MKRSRTANSFYNFITGMGGSTIAGILRGGRDCLPAGADGTAPIVFYSSLGRWLSRLFGGNDA